MRVSKSIQKPFSQRITKTFNFAFSPVLKKDVECKQRRKLFEHAKKLMSGNQEGLRLAGFKGNLEYVASLALSSKYLHFEEKSFSEEMKNLIREKTAELSPELCLKITDFLVREPEVVDEGDILKQIYQYIDLLYFNFTYEQLQRIENNFYMLDKKLNLGFNPKMANYLGFTKMRLKSDPQEFTEKVLKHRGVVVDKSTHVVRIGDHEKYISIHFKETGQNLRLVALPPEEDAYDMILSIRKVIMKETQERVFILDRPPMSYSDYLRINEQEDGIADFKKKARAGVRLRTGEKSGPLKRLSEDLESYILDKENLGFYLEKIILKDKEKYFLKEAEKIVKKSE